ncbi:MAG: type II toxin-antitoxin system VapC family toxin [Caulobacteraceae bacterium]|nr:type II toxin-antitoxin system VapC family toxin [Caulobacteraceae bacterium]
MIVIDASAVCAIALHEPERDAFIDAVNANGGGWISPLGVWESRISVTRRLSAPSLLVDGILSALAVTLVATDQEQTDLAFEAWRRFGKGRHPARLNLGGCFAYALAKSRNLPMLYKGDDFAKTDVASAF